MCNNFLYEKYYRSDTLSKEQLNSYMFDLDFFLKNNYVVSKIEIDEYLPPTPVHTGFVDESLIPTAISNLFAFLKSMNLYPVVYEGENEGKLIRNVVPRIGLEEEVSSYGSKISFFPHVDNPDLKLRHGDVERQQSTCPDTLTLLCLRQTEGVATSIILLKDIIDEMEDEDVKLLQESYYKINRPASFSESVVLENMPILTKDVNSSYLSRFDYHNVYSDSLPHSIALEKFKAISLQPTKWKIFYLKPGQAITFDNQKVLHTRNGFTPKFDGEDRWLLRIFGLFQKPSPNFFVSKQCNHHLTVS